MFTTEDFTGETAIVTGASAGIGAAFAEGLAQRGADLVLVARRESRLNELATHLENSYSISTTVVPMDLSDPDIGGRLRSAIPCRPSILINNAGFATYGPIADVAVENDLKQVAVNTAACVQLCHEFLPDMLASQHGLIINVSSVAAFLATPYLPVYGATKSFLLSYSEALWFEAKRNGVHVHATCPGATETEWFDVVGNRKETLFGEPVHPQVVVDNALASALAGRPSAVVGGMNRLATILPRVVPKRLALRFAGRQTLPHAGTQIAEGGMVSGNRSRS